MRSVAATVGEVDGLELAEGGRSERGISRTAVFAYAPTSTARDGLDATVMLEMGIRGGPHPTEVRQIQSMLGAALDGRIDDALRDRPGGDVFDRRDGLVHRRRHPVDVVSGQELEQCEVGDALVPVG